MITLELTEKEASLLVAETALAVALADAAHALNHLQREMDQEVVVDAALTAKLMALIP